MLLQQLREITRVMKEGKFIDDISPEKEAEEAPYMADWEGKQEPFLPLPLHEKLDYSQFQILSKFWSTLSFLFQKPVLKTLQEVAGLFFSSAITEKNRF